MARFFYVQGLGARPSADRDGTNLSPGFGRTVNGSSAGAHSSPFRSLSMKLGSKECMEGSSDRTTLRVHSSVDACTVVDAHTILTLSRSKFRATSSCTQRHQRHHDHLEASQVMRPYSPLRSGMFQSFETDGIKGGTSVRCSPLNAQQPLDIGITLSSSTPINTST